MPDFWDERLDLLGVTIESADHTKEHWYLEAGFIIPSGSWGEYGDGTVPLWAWNYHADIGGDTTVYGRAYENGEIATEAGFFMVWPDMDKPPVMRLANPADGWYANDHLQAGFDWSKTSGPYSWQKYGNADIVHGLGLPYPPLPWEAGAPQAAGGVHVGYVFNWIKREPHVAPSFKCRIAGFLRSIADKLC